LKILDGNVHPILRKIFVRILQVNPVNEVKL